MADQGTKRRGACLWVAASIFASVATVPVVFGLESRPVAYGDGAKIGVLQNRDIDESSGLALSRIREGVFWTHNDSGDKSRIFAFDRNGRDLGVWTVKGVSSYDWEDMASFLYRGKPCLLLADVGDNAKLRRTCALHVVEEPGRKTDKARCLLSVRFRYEDGPQDCEAVAVDHSTGDVLLVSKVRGIRSMVYRLRIPSENTGQVVVARRFAPVSVPFVTALDLSPDGCRAIVLTYGPAFEFTRRSGEDWSAAFRREPRMVKLPTRRQGEAICYGNDGKALYLTSEKAPSPFWHVPAKEQAGSGD